MPSTWKILIDRDAPKDLSFTYSSEEELAIGDYVAVLLKGHITKGYVIERDSSLISSKVQKVLGRIFDIPLVPPHLMDLSIWFSEYYISNLSQSLSIIIPSEVRDIKVSYREEKLQINIPKERKSRKNVFYFDYKFSLDQEPIQCPSDRDVLLRFPIEKRIVTYLKMIEEDINSNRGVIILFPELDIVLSLESLFRKLFSDKVAVLYSTQKPAYKNREWWKIRNGEAIIAIGNRASIFAPVRNLSKIIIDEEEDESYKDEHRPFYDAREVAVKLREITGCQLIWGGSVPSLERYSKALDGSIKLIEEKVDELPKVKLINMRSKRGILSSELIHSCKVNLARKKQTLILINRKGYFTFQMCKECGYLSKCPYCGVPLVYHKDEGLICHYCGYRQNTVSVCPKCGQKMSLLGYGTERIEDVLKKIFSNVRISRIDSDIPEREANRIWKDFLEKRIDILVGTQMILKGLYLPDVTLIGMVSAETGLYLPDFRISERVFRLIYKISERCNKDKRAVVQTIIPDYYAIKYAVRLDFKDFYRYESRVRKPLGYPPWTRLIRILIQSREEEKAKIVAESVAKDLERKLAVEYSGPAKAPIYNIKGIFRWHIVLKLKEIDSEICRVVKELVESYNYKDISVTVDIDPVSTL
ncbi:MAG: replication restart helicase PriA [bacterium]